MSIRSAMGMVCAVLSACGDTPEQVQPASPGPLSSATPAYVAEGACPFECCHYGRWRLAESAIVRAGPSLGADSVGHVAASTTVPADSGVVIIATSGLVAITASASWPEAEPLPLAVGDTIEILDYQGEGISRIRWRDWLMFMSQFWDSTGSRGGRLLRQPEQAWWARVADRGTHGWILVTAIPDSGADACQ